MPDTEDKYLIELGNRLREVADLRGGVRALANATGIRENQLHRYIKGENAPTVPVLVQIAEGAGVSVEWLATGQGEMKDEAVAGTFAMVPQLTVLAAAGGGAVAEGEEGLHGFVAFRRDWLRDNGFVPEDLVAIRVMGDSMEPTIPEGSLVLVDRREEARRGREGIFVLRVDEDLLVKRLQRAGDNQVVVKSDNPVYKDWILTGTSANAEVIGRVVWMGKRV